MTKTRPFLSMCYGDPSATEVPPCCETATKKLTFSTTSVLLLLNMPLSLSRATIFRRQKNPRRVYRPKIAGILFVCNEPEGKYYTVPCCIILADNKQIIRRFLSNRMGTPLLRVSPFPHTATPQTTLHDVTRVPCFAFEQSFTLTGTSLFDSMQLYRHSIMHHRTQF